ncbi:ROK family transcriptional regulator [Paenibacillus glycanilyticus]|uniref:ROK family transcriptional regulator n=1 Tax=Paenibacillus glycanilyticus TaxID=126569 RepID=UPI00203DDA35|nr:ROK family transcriptional regulator [Paenibacillus glycanilyticus]MCM3629718.1 ROK family transcriptional regulator [Paenibacillus glycanilyticus]
MSEKHDQEYIKNKNRILVLGKIRKHRPVSRVELAKLTDMSATAIGRIVGDLIEAGLVKETDQYSTGVGRKATMLDLDGHAIVSVGVEVDRDWVRIGLVDLEDRIFARSETRLDRSLTGSEHVEATIENGVRALFGERGIDFAQCIGVGIGMPGVIDQRTRTVVFSAQMGWSNVSVAKRLEERLGVPVMLDNDLKVKALGESETADAADKGVTVLISIGSGVGSAVVIDGRIYRGASNIAGEIGHSTVDPNGKLCECGKRGCLQTYITDLAMLQEANQIKQVDSVEELYGYMRKGEGWAANIVDRACTYIAITINNVVCTYNPDSIILTGNFIDLDPDIMDRVRGKLKEFIWEPFVGTFELTRSRLGDQAVLLGSAKLALQTYLSNGLQAKIQS